MIVAPSAPNVSDGKWMEPTESGSVEPDMFENQKQFERHKLALKTSPQPRVDSKAKRTHPLRVLPLAIGAAAGVLSVAAAASEVLDDIPGDRQAMEMVTDVISGSPARKN